MLNNNNICDIVEHNTDLSYTFKCTFLKYHIQFTCVQASHDHSTTYCSVQGTGLVDGRSNIGSYNVHVNMYICK